MSDCTCGYNGWFSPPDPNCPDHGSRGARNSDYQRGLQDSGKVQVHCALDVILDVLASSSRLSREDARTMAEQIARRLGLLT